jgi:hypothetical protein
MLFGAIWISISEKVSMITFTSGFVGLLFCAYAVRGQAALHYFMPNSFEAEKSQKYPLSGALRIILFVTFALILMVLAYEHYFL